MKRRYSESTSRLPIWFVKLCKWLWNKQKFIWTTIVIGIILNLFATWLFTPWSTNYKKLPIWIIFQNPIISLFTGIMLILVICIIYITSLSDDEKINNYSKVTSSLDTTDEKNNEATLTSSEEPKRRYLLRVIREYETLTLKGIPAGLIDKGVRLDEVFIPVELRPNRPLAEYPLTERELKDLHEYQEKGALSEEMERLLVDAEKNWYHHFNKIDRIKFVDLWARLSSRYPADVIQGYPGMGKSTLMARLTLYMARRCLSQKDTTMPDQLEKPLVPVFLSLGRYATEIVKANQSEYPLSVAAYLELILQQMNIPGLVSFIRESLSKGHCLILLDGLDEVSNLLIRKEIQEAIKIFVAEQSDTSVDVNNFNHFIITSRVAGYDQNAFPSYEHYTIAELTSEQIKDFLPRWCRACTNHNQNYVSYNQGDVEKAIATEAKELENRLNYAVEHNQGVRDLVEIPLMLTLLAVMQQNSIELPRERVELYTTVTRTLLENRNIAKNLPIIPEALAIQRLGPIAFQMQETGNSFVRQGDVLALLKQIIHREQGGTADQIAQEAEAFLDRIRERAGLFTQRTGDYFSFFHRSFQEYFAARYILNEIKDNPDKSISELIEKAQRSDDLWREPFLFAVAYKSRDDETVTRLIIQNLLGASPYRDFNVRVHDILLAGECVVESKNSTLGSKLEKQVVEQLLQIYEEAQKNQLFAICTQIEAVVQRWLISLPSESYRPVLLTILSESVINAHGLGQQCAALTLLAMISSDLSFCSSIIFDELIPHLLAVTGLPKLNKYSASIELTTKQSFIAVDLAVTTLSAMGSYGPGGLLLLDIREYFKNYPQQLQLLAKHSVEMQTLLTLIPIPESLENYQKYKPAIISWHNLLNQVRKDNITINNATNICLDIHRLLLNIGTEVRYPAAKHFINVLQIAESTPNMPARKVWQNYLINCLNTSNYADYHDLIILWLMLFRDDESTMLINKLILEHFTGNSYLQCYAQRFIASVCVLLRCEADIDYQLDINHSAGATDARFTDFIGGFRVGYFLEQYKDLFLMRESDIRLGEEDIELGESGIFDFENSIIVIMYVNSKKHSNVPTGFITNFYEFLKNLLKKEVIAKTMDLLSVSFLAHSKDVEAQKDLVDILLGQVIFGQVFEMIDEAFKQEIQKILPFVLHNMTLSDNKEIKDIMLNVLRNLPTRSADEINYVISIIEKTPEKELREAYSEALIRSRPKTIEGWRILEAAEQSEILEVSSAAKERLLLRDLSSRRIRRKIFSSGKHPLEVNQVD